MRGREKYRGRDRRRRDEKRGVMVRIFRNYEVLVYNAKIENEKLGEEAV